VYVEELIDKKLMKCRRVVNEGDQTIDFLEGPALNSSAFAGKQTVNKAVFRTSSEERQRVVLQLGTAEGGNAVKAAEVVCRDVQAIDINMGCPKHFSIQGGMGAKLLEDPERARDIVATVGRNLRGLPVTAKMRRLATDEKTVDFARQLERAGVAAVAVHARFVHERPRDPASWDAVRPVVEALSVPVIANGDVCSHDDFQKYREATGCAGVMAARGAQWNCSIFRSEGLEGTDVVRHKFMQRAAQVRNNFQNSKFILKEMLVAEKKGSSPEWQMVNKCKSGEDLAALYSSPCAFSRRAASHTPSAEASMVHRHPSQGRDPEVAIAHAARHHPANGAKRNREQATTYGLPQCPDGSAKRTAFASTSS